ncbi:hypothetical protein QN277_001906 [Acacia crassicarpa]|nr:hypothetical protein QN277_001906 [Acacia crassicarpa]
MEFGSLEYWRNYFRTANTDIFNVIDHAIMVAISDHPNEFRLRRDQISERLFSWGLTRSVGCNPLRSVVSDDDKEDGGCKCSFSRKATELEGGSTKERKGKSGRDNEINRTQVSSFSFGEDEGFIDEIEKESMIVAEILRIKEILRMEKADSVLFESLRRLQPLALTVDLLKETEIGKAVNPLKKHSSKEISQLARTLIDGWKAMVDEWIKSTEAIEAKGAPDSINASVINEEEELPSPPLDEVAMRQSKPVCTDSSSSRQPKCSLPQKSNTGPKMQQKPKKYVILRRRPLVAQQDCQKFKCSDDVSVQAKLEATKRKLHDSYQQAANAKKQRSIRVIELHDLPKQGNIGPQYPHSSKLFGRF